MDKIIYKIKKNRIAMFIIFLFAAIIFLVYSNFESINLTSSIKDNGQVVPHLLVTKGSAIIKRDMVIRLKEKEKSDLEIGDKIRTFEESNATIFWPDGSVTRLGAKTGLEIKDMYASKNLSKINIKFNLEEGKTWSNIVKFLNKDSNFTETYDDGNYAATVRGTVFEMNLDEGYVHAVNHDVTLTDVKDNGTSSIPEGGAKSMFNIKNNVPSDVWDADWIQKNIGEDSDYINELAKAWKEKLQNAMASRNFGTESVDYIKKAFSSKNDFAISNISDSLLNGDDIGMKKVQDMIPSLSAAQKADLNKNLVELYQNIHTLPNDDATASDKTELRDMILNTSSDEDKKALLANFARLNIYDYLDVTKDNASKVSGALKKNIEGYLNQMSDPQEVKDLLSSFGIDMLSVLGVDFSQISKESDEIMKKLKDEGFQKSLKKDIIRNATKLNDSIDNVLEK